jgi:plasmid stability protein
MPRKPILKDSRVVQLVFERELYERLREMAARQGRSISSLVRDAVARYLESLASGPSSDDPPEATRSLEFVTEDLGLVAEARTSTTSRAGGGLSNEGEVDR